MPATSTSTTGHCRRCDLPLADNRAAGLCVACLGDRLQFATQPTANGGGEPSALPAGFELVDSLGRGGMGEVSLVYQEKLARYVAMKQLSGAWQHDSRARDRFLREAQATARLSHPGIVPILEIGTNDAYLWYTMEYVEGGDLAELLARHGGKLPWREAVMLVLKVAEAIQHAHAAGVAHRDLKPSNILLDSGGAPKVADFGLAWFAGGEGKTLTITGEVLGTPAYLPPEALDAAGRTADPRQGDIYSLGALLFHLVAGQPPFDGNHAVEIYGAIARRPAPRLSSINPGEPVPPALDEICAICLRKKPGERFASMRELIEALRSCSTDDGTGFLRQRRRRRIGWFAIAAVVLAALIAGADRWGEAMVRQRFFGLTASAAAPVIAVAPLEAMGSDEGTAMLAGALQDEIVATLVRITDLKVIATRSARKLNTGSDDTRLARESLGADVILTGKVRKWEDKIWASVQLVDTSDSTVRWSHTYIMRETNALNLQTDIATEIAVQLNRRLRVDPADAARQGTSSRFPPAQAQYSQARALMMDSSNLVAQFARAEALLEEAVKTDPAFALAYAQLSLVHTQMYNWGNDRTERRLARGLEAAQKALELSPNLAEAEIALGHYYYRGSRDFVTARLHLDRARALSPNNSDALEALAHVERRQGSFETAAGHFEAALRLDPLNAILAYNTADTFLRLRDYEKAAAVLDHALSLLPKQVALMKLRGDLFVAWKGELAPMRDDIEQRDPALPTPDLYLMDRIEYLILAHRLDEALAALRGSRLTILEGQSIYLARDGYEALLLRLAGKDEAARPLARRALVDLDRELAKRPNDPRVLLHAGQMHAIAGEVPEAERLVRRTLTPGDLACADAFDRGLYLRSFAIMLAGAGEDAKALAVLHELLREPNQTSVAYIAMNPALTRFAKEIR